MSPLAPPAARLFSSPWQVALALAVGLGVPLGYGLLSDAPPAAPQEAGGALAPGVLAVQTGGAAAPSASAAGPWTAAGPFTTGPVAAGPVASAAPRAVSGLAAATSGPAEPPPEARQMASQRDPSGDLSPDVTDFINAGETPTMADVIARLQAAGVHAGLGAFSPPGTRPPLVGLAVPDDFELPPGYVRHHQTTDDGQPIEPILMFSPDLRWTDAQGRAVAPPADRVVPVELAPPGLPIRRIVVPAPAPPGR